MKRSFFSAVDSPTSGTVIDMEIDLIAAGADTALAEDVLKRDDDTGDGSVLQLE